MRRRGVRAALVFALIAPAIATPALAGIDEATAAFKAGRYLEAASELQAVLDQSMGYAYGHFLLGHCMLKEGLVREAEREFQRALSLDPTRAEYYQGYALSLSATGNWPLAVRVTSEGLAREHDPRTRWALLALRAYAWGALRRWKDAVTDLEAAQRIRSETWILVFLGKARFATEAYADAVPPLRRALLSAPEDPAVLRLLAESLLRLAAAEPDPTRKRFLYTDALANAQRLASVTPDDLDAVHLVGRAALGAGRFDQAVDVFRHVLGQDPRQCYAMANLGRTYMALSRWAEAEAYLRKASVCAPRLSSVYDSLGELYMQLGKLQEAAAAYRKSEELEPTRRGADRSLMVPVFAPR